MSDKSDKVYASKASKGFSKHLSHNAQIALGFLVVVFSITPAIFFTCSLIILNPACALASKMNLKG